jgi:exosortase
VSAVRITDRFLIVTLVLAFLPAVHSLARSWAAVDYQSQGFFVPLVSAWIAAGRRRHLRRLPSAPDRRGAVLLAAALVLYAASLLSGSVAGEGLALIGAIAATIWSLRGTRWLRALAFPIAYLVFMLPLPSDWIGPVVVRLQLWVTAGAIAVLHGVGVGATRAGNVLVLGNGQELFVAEACSGLTSLLTLTPIAVLIAYLAPLPRERRVLLVALALPIALAANLLRVVLTALAARIWSASAVTSEPWHELAGLAVYAVACVLLLVAAQLLRPRMLAAG